MKNRKLYELTVEDGKFRALEVGSDPAKTRYLSAGDNRDAALKEVEEMNAKYYLTDYAPEEIEEFWQGLDITPVNEFFSKLLNLPVKLEKQASKNYRNDVRYALADPTNIAAQSAITNAAWREMYVQTFGCAVSINKETGALYFWADIHLSYRHWGGGTNGATIGNIMYANGAWEIESEQQRQTDRA